MTVGAIVFGRRMAESLGQELRFLFAVAGKAKVLSLGDQAVAKWRAVRIMARHAIAHGDGTMNLLLDALVVDVTLEA